MLRRAIDNPESLCADARLDGKFEGHGSLAGKGDLRATPLRDLAFQNAGGVLHRRRCLREQNTPAPNRPAPPKGRHRKAAAQARTGGALQPDLASSPCRHASLVVAKMPRTRPASKPQESQRLLRSHSKVGLWTKADSVTLFDDSQLREKVTVGALAGNASAGTDTGCLLVTTLSAARIYGTWNLTTSVLSCR